MGEAELMYNIELLYDKYRRNYNNPAIKLKVEHHINRLSWQLFVKTSKRYSDYTDEERTNLVAEHTLLGE